MADKRVRTNPLRRLRARLVSRRMADDQGMALIAVIILATVMSMIGGVIIVDSTSELSRSTVQVDKTSALQAAQAGIDDYLAKMAQDNLYYFHYVNQAEPQRTPLTGPVTSGVGTFEWLGTNPWTYTTPRRWVALGTQGYEYSILITAPTATDTAVTILSTGRKVGEPKLGNWRAIQTKVRGSSVADFQVIVDDDYPIGKGATTNGRIYSTGDICHDGVATADLLAEGHVNPGSCAGTPTVSMQAPLLPAGAPVAKIYDASTPAPNDLRSQIPIPIEFNLFTNALATLKSVAASPSGLNLTDTNPAMKTWKLVFLATGKIDVYKCSAVVDENGTSPPPCVLFQNVDVPTIGAIYVDKPVIVSGIVKGRVTLASPVDIFIGGNITYQTPGKDVLGLVAKSNITVPLFAIDSNGNLTWWSAAVAMEGSRQQGYQAYGMCRGAGSCPASKSTLTYVGSIAMKLFGNGQSDLFYYRNYNYDSNLAFLQPPFFPVISVNYSVLLFREIAPAP